MLDAVYILGRDEVPQGLTLRTGDVARLTFISLPGTSCELNFAVDLVGEGSELDAAGLYLCTGAERLSLNLTIRHLSPAAKSNQLFKGIADGTSKVSFKGLIHVTHGAEKTEAYQASHALLLSRDAKVENCPQLEIYADDVICSHGATVGYLNEDEQFYMRSRGIPELQARRLQILSFLSPVLSRLTPAQFAFLDEAVPQLGLSDAVGTLQGEK